MQLRTVMVIATAFHPALGLKAWTAPEPEDAKVALPWADEIRMPSSIARRTNLMTFDRGLNEVIFVLALVQKFLFCSCSLALCGEEVERVSFCWLRWLWRAGGSSSCTSLSWEIPYISLVGFGGGISLSYTVVGLKSWRLTTEKWMARSWVHHKDEIISRQWAEMITWYKS